MVRSEHRERCRIAHILHEDLQQELVATKFLCAELKEKSSTPLKASLADRTLNQLDHAIDITRTLSVDLRPHVLNHMSMGKCIEWLAADVKKRLGLNVRVRVGKAPDIGSDEMRIFAYEAARELLLNVIKHAKVKSAEVLFSSMGADRVKLQIRDKGVGFAPEHNQVANRHFGHFSIQERAELLGGLFEVRSQPGKGTCATLILPSGRCSSLSGDVQPG